MNAIPKLRGRRGDDRYEDARRSEREREEAERRLARVQAQVRVLKRIVDARQGVVQT